MTGNFFSLFERGAWPRRAPPAASVLVLCVGVLLGALAPVPEAVAQHYNVASYQVADGLPASRVLSLFQDSRGYLWMGTTGGAARYNGEEFRLFTSADGLAGNTVTAIAEAATGEILLGSQEGGVSAWDGDRLRPVLSDMLTDESVRTLVRDGDRIWIGTARGLVRVGADVVEYGPQQGLPADGVHAVLRDRQGRLWVGTGAGLLRWEGTRFRAMGDGLPASTTVRTLTEHPDGGLWLGTDAGLFRRAADGFRRVPTPLRRGDVEPAVTAAAGHESGRLWFGTARGALRVSGEEVVLLGVGNGLADSHVNATIVDREGNAWFGTDRGVAKLVPGPFSHFTVADGLPHDFITSIAPAGDAILAGTRDGIVRIDADGGARIVASGSALPAPVVTALLSLEREGLLVGTSAGLVAWQDGIRRRWGVEDGLPSARVSALARAPDGTVWVGTDAGLARLGVAGALREQGGPLASLPITALTVAADGRVWAAARDRGVFVQEDGEFRTRPLGPEEPTRVTVWSLASAGDRVWAGTNGLGVFRFDPDGARMRLTRERTGLANDFVQQVLVASDGRVWLYTNRGLDRWDPRVGFTHYDLADGLGSMAGSPGAAARGSDGRLWFGTPSGLTVYRPEVLDIAAVPPTVVVEEFLAGGRPISRQERRPVLPASDSDVAFEFAALSFRQEEATRYQYRLLGQDERWSRPTRDRRVAYVGLPPGEYTFQVQAISGEGRWSDEPAEVAFEVRPAVWETTWFRIGLALAALAVIALLFRGRIRQVETERRRLREMVDRRTRELVEKNTQLERMATTDDLTGLPNRRFFLESLEREIRKLCRVESDQELSVLILDLDRFKGINDRFGHAAGDEVLRQVAKRMARNVRATDLPARFGGEEFAIMLPNTGVDGARFLAEKLRDAVENARLRFDGTVVPLTISIGVATTAGRPRYSPAIEEDLLRRADEAMYRAKEGGRNRVEVDPESA